MNKNLSRKLAASCAAFALLMSLSACTGTTASTGAKADNPSSTTSSQKKQEEKPKADKPKEPEKKKIPTHPVGELIKLPSANFTVKAIEQREEIESSFPDFEPNFKPEPGKRLWYFDIEWTNNTNEAVDKECHGPYNFNLRVFDINGVEMTQVQQPGFIIGNNCDTGLQKGETGRWQTAFNGLDADFGWAVFEDFAGDASVVTLDPNLELSLPTGR